MALFAALPSGCMFIAAREQQQSLDATCLISGSVASARKDSAPIVVVLLQREEAPLADGRQWRLVDHFVLDTPGHWGFGTGPGRYAVLAFKDRSRDLVYNPGESYGAVGADEPLECRAGGRLSDIALAIPEKADKPLPKTVDIPKLQRRDAEGQLKVTFGQMTAAGEVVSLKDERFSRAHAEDGLWRPYDFLTAGRAGVYFLEPYDAGRVPVLFVHGINGTPIDFEYLVGRLDRTRFQPWVYYYPSGVHLGNVADHLEQTITKLRVRYRVPRFAVVAHSMGGLVSRGFIQRYARDGGAGLPLFVSISTPWGGHKAAQTGVDTAPVVVRVWNDMAPGSEYQKSLYVTPLPGTMRHHLLFTFKGSASGESGDGAVSVASQLLPQAQRDAVKLYGFDDTHTGVLRDPQVSLLVNQLLAETFR
jgi:pimeloyl-ACP methyl ester carboxylesterase